MRYFEIITLNNNQITATTEVNMLKYVTEKDFRNPFIEIGGAVINLNQVVYIKELPNPEAQNQENISNADENKIAE